MIVADSIEVHPNGNAAGAPQHLGGYELGQLLGVGGMAEVFKAEYTAARGARRTVVVKRILPRHAKFRDEGDGTRGCRISFAPFFCKGCG